LRNAVWARLARIPIAAISCFGLVWGVYVLPSSTAADRFWSLEIKLLHFETFEPELLEIELKSSAASSLSDCDTHSQTALLLAEMHLAEAALRKKGELQDFDLYSQSMESRSKRVLSCAPRSSYVWLLAFSLELLHGRLDQRTFAFLAMSYDTSPNEAWISIRRNIVAIPLVLVVPQPLQSRILVEFQQLIRNGFQDEAARSYSSASTAVRALLQNKIEQLEPSLQKRLSDAITRNKS
jgi:hypothetical protein